MAANAAFELQRTHALEDCGGQWCIIHKPKHPPEHRHLNWREDLGLFEEICEHGIGHPVPETPPWINTRHGCDGCCNSW